VPVTLPADLLSPNQLAKKLGISKSTIIVWTHAGIIDAEIAIGKLWKFDEGKVLERLRQETERRRSEKLKI
jgi:excisionase family DNA binding protein